MKIWSSEHIFNHSWDNVVKAALKKYPNPLNPNVIGVDVIDRHVDGHMIKSHRLLTTKWSLPQWTNKVIGAHDRACFASEHSHIDIKNKEMSMRSRNLTLNHFINVEEKLTYCVHPEDETKTLLKQEAQITVQNMPLISYLENMIIKSMNSNAQKGRQAIEYIIHKMNDITDEATHSMVKNTQNVLDNIKPKFVID
jgi:hypothetical protein